MVGIGWDEETWVWVGGVSPVEELRRRSVSFYGVG